RSYAEQWSSQRRLESFARILLPAEEAAPGCGPECSDAG
ncbi:unnamed protein product, partial [marine sediment metagenome]